jgi:hypothetical protein
VPAASTAVRNPFTPGAGYPPPFLAGRDEMLGGFERHLKAAVRVPRHVVLTGLRGTGKTVLLGEFRKLAQLNGWLSAERELDETENETATLVRATAADLMRIGTGASLALRMRRTGRRLYDTFKPKDLEAWGIRYSPTYAKEPRAPAADRLIRMFEELMPLVRHSHRGLVLFYDEFHEVWDGRRKGQAPLATLFGAVKRVQLGRHPVMLVVSGLPTVVPNIVKSRSYLERDLVVFRLDNLDPRDARAAIARPLGRSRVSFTPALIDRIVTETRGYPYFLQYYASFLIETVPDEDRFDVDALELLRPLLLNELDQSFFSGRYAKLPKAERDALVAIAQVGERARVEAVVWPGSRALLRASIARLVDRGQLYRPSERGEVAFSLPLYRDFLLRLAPR